MDFIFWTNLVYASGDKVDEFDEKNGYKKSYASTQFM